MEVSKLSYQTCSHPCILYMLVGATTQSGTAHSISTSTDRCCILALPGLPPISAQTGRCCSLAHLTQSQPHSSCKLSIFWPNLAYSACHPGSHKCQWVLWNGPIQPTPRTGLHVCQQVLQTSWPGGPLSLALTLSSRNHGLIF